MRRGMRVLAAALLAMGAASHAVPAAAQPAAGARVGWPSRTPRVFACEVDTASPFDAALRAGAPTAAVYTPSFVDGIGSKRVADEMWPLASTLLDGSIVVSLKAVADAVKLLVERARVVAEGAGAAAVGARRPYCTLWQHAMTRAPAQQNPGSGQNQAGNRLLTV